MKRSLKFTAAPIKAYVTHKRLTQQCVKPLVKLCGLVDLFRFENVSAKHATFIISATLTPISISGNISKEMAK